MKNPLNYQVSDFDCGPTTLLNAISFLFRREEIPPDIIQHIILYSLDVYNKNGEFGKNGTSKMAMMFLCNWLNQFGKVKKFPIQCEFLENEEVFLAPNSRIVSGIQQGGAVVVRLFYDCWHYAVLTGIDKENVYLFDPYYRKRDFNLDGVTIINDKPTKWNRKISFERLNKSSRGMYQLGPMDIREAMIIFNKNAREIPPEIEYYI